MAVRRKFNSIFQVARDWKMNRINIMQLIIAGELKASLLQKDVGITNFDKFSDLPQDLRENLNVIRPKGMTKDEYSKLLKPWQKIVITDEEMERYVANNPPKENLPTQVAINDNGNPKIIRSLLILVATMAIKGYSYKPVMSPLH